MIHLQNSIEDTNEGNTNHLKISFPNKVPDIQHKTEEIMITFQLY